MNKINFFSRKFVFLDSFFVIAQVCLIEIFVFFKNWLNTRALRNLNEKETIVLPYSTSALNNFLINKMFEKVYNIFFKGRNLMSPSMRPLKGLTFDFRIHKYTHMLNLGKHKIENKI